MLYIFRIAKISKETKCVNLQILWQLTGRYISILKIAKIKHSTTTLVIWLMRSDHGKFL